MSKKNSCNIKELNNDNCLCEFDIASQESQEISAQDENVYLFFCGCEELGELVERFAQIINNRNLENRLQ